jgi:hypothetical protein
MRWNDPNRRVSDFGNGRRKTIVGANAFVEFTTGRGRSILSLVANNFAARKEDAQHEQHG